MRRYLPRELEDSAARVWADRHEISRALRGLPATLCHLDLWPRNLFLETTERAPALVAIDWAFVGIGTVGEDAGNLIPDSMFDLFVDARVDAVALTESVVLGYAEGLAEGGARVAINDLRFAIAASASLKYVWMSHWLLRAAAAEGARKTATEQQFGLPFDAFYARRAAVVRHLASLADEARRLLPGVVRP